MNHDAEMIIYLQRCCGYCLCGDISEKAFCVLLGEPNTGKTTFMNVLIAILGEYARTAAISTFLVRQHGTATSDVARLANARLVSTSEAKDRQTLSEEFVKLITGGGKVTSRHLYKEEFEYTPQYKLFMDTNTLPRIDTEDQALWNRMKVIKFTRQFTRGVDMDEKLPQKLQEELSGILNWCLAGFDAWYAQGLNTPATVVAFTHL